ncbi:MAG TPA: MarR family transcriptional regulator [Candidatus Saccharimonadales bacterium]|nr:MarR family transcriptional regulator [Candidatus Saccharimonadales bacterium]
MGPSNNIGYRLQHLSFVLQRHSDQALQEQLGIGFSQFKILMVLQWHPQVQQKQIAERLGQTEASISRQINLLKKQGLLERVPSPENRRQHLTRTTQKGEKLTDKALEILNNYHAPMFARLSDKQQNELQEILKIMHDYACSGDSFGDKH